jgi:multiple sugar transport system ATP-binding protein/alpha-glucoside transport system ATP-binding protein
MGTIKLVEELGEYTIVYVDIGAPDLFIAKLLNSISLRKGEPIKLNFCEAVHFFDQDTRRVSI